MIDQSESQPVNEGPRTIRRRHRRPRKRPKHAVLDVLLNERTLLGIVSALLVVFLVVKAREFIGLAVYSDVMPRQHTSDVLYAKGRPVSVQNFAGGGARWNYESPPVRVSFSADGLVESVSCSGGGRGVACPPVLNVGIGTDEYNLASVLGSPTDVEILDGAKIFHYSDVGLAFRLEQFTVREIAVRRRGDRLRYVARFLTWVIPPAI